MTRSIKYLSTRPRGRAFVVSIMQRRYVRFTNKQTCALLFPFFRDSGVCVFFEITLPTFFKKKKPKTY